MWHHEEIRVAPNHTLIQNVLLNSTVEKLNSTLCANVRKATWNAILAACPGQRAENRQCSIHFRSKAVSDSAADTQVDVEKG